MKQARLQLLFLTPTTAAQAEDPIDIGSRRELFVDDHLIDRMDRASLKLHRPVPRERVVACDHEGSA